MASTSTAEENSDVVSFIEMGLDDRILKAIATLGWAEPTPIQEKAIPLALDGKDILARARTGSGKTAAFAIPLVQNLLRAKQTASEQEVRAVVLTPTRDLCTQAYKKILEVSNFCRREIRCVDISPQASLDSQRPLLCEKPDIVVGTPKRILEHVRVGNLELHAVKMIVIDEADMVFSFGHEQDFKKLLEDFPQIFQAILMSATLSEDVNALKKMVLHNPVVLKLRESQLPEKDKLKQYFVKCEMEEKFTLVAAIMQLPLIRGKTIFFVNSVDSCYKLKLFLEPFGIQSCVLNSELPVKSRVHVVTQFNEGVYDNIIASDEHMLENPQQASSMAKARVTRKKDQEYGVSRGIDFHNVSNVVNFEFPRSVDAYIHRVGRTARGDKQGCALSFVSMKDNALFEKVDEALRGSDDTSVFKPYSYSEKELQTFKYRAEEAMRSVTRTDILDARRKELRQEILNDQALRTYFEDNPVDKKVIQHVKVLGGNKLPETLKHVPDYAVPSGLKGVARQQRRMKKARGKAASSAKSTSQAKYNKRKADPLRSFEFSGFSKRKK